MAFSVQAHFSSSQIVGGDTVTLTISASDWYAAWGASVTTALAFDGIVSGTNGAGLVAINHSVQYRNSDNSGTIVLRYKSLLSQSGTVTATITAKSRTFNEQTAGSVATRTVTVSLNVTPHPDYAPLPQLSNLQLSARTDTVPDRFLKAKGTWSNITQAYSYVEVETKNSAGTATVQDNYRVTNIGSSSTPLSDRFTFPAFDTTYQVRARFVRETPSSTGAWSTATTWTTEAEPSVGNASNAAAVASVDQPEIRVSCTVPRLLLPTTDPRYNLYYLSINVYRSTTIDGTYELLRAGTAFSNGNLGSTVIFTDTECQFDTEYFYKVKACLPGASSYESASFTSVVNATTIAEPGPPEAPDLALFINNYRSISLSWDQFPSNTSFIVRRSTGASGQGGPYTQIAEVPAGSTSYTDESLSPSTIYWFKITARNPYGNTDSEIVGAQTPIAPDAPPEPSGLVATALTANRVRLSWTEAALPETLNPSGNAPEYFDVLRSETEGGPYATIVSVPPEQAQYVDGSAAANTTYYYVVRARNAGGNSSNSNEAEVTTPERSATLLQDLGFTFVVGALTKIMQVAGRLIFWSSRNRPVVWANRRSYKAGLKPQLEAPEVEAAADGALTGDFRAYIMLVRSDGGTPSRPSPASDQITLDGEKLVITPQVDPDDNTKIHVRDIGYDSSGNEISGCDFYEVYIWDINSAQGRPNYVATLPITTLSYTTDADFDNTKLARGKFMFDFQNLLPPAAGIAEYNPTTSRVLACGSETLKPTAAETAAGARVQIEQGETTCTIENWTPADPDALIHKELRLNRASTNWFVEDIEGDTIYLRHSDPIKHEEGFAGANGPYADFAFSDNPSRVSLSCYETASDVEIAFQPETFPPRYIEGELNPDDNQNPNGMISSRDVLLTTKPNSCFFMAGGAGLDEDPINGFPQVVNVSRGSGLIAPKTICRDRFDTAYGLNDQGPFTLDQTGVRNVGEMAGVAWLLQKFYDIDTADGAVGCFFQRENYFIVCGLNRKGRSGNRDWFIYDTRNNAVMMQTFPTRITALLPTHTDSGETQLLYGDENCNLGVLLRTGSYVDGTDYTRGNPSDGESRIVCSLTTGVVAPTYGFSPDRLRPHIKVDDLPEPVQFIFEYDDLNRSGESGEFVASKTVTWSVRRDRNPDHVPLKRRGCQTARFRLSFIAPKSQLRMQNIEMEAVEHGR